MKKVIWLSLAAESHARGYWDQALLEDGLSSLQFTDSVEPTESAIVIVPGAVNKHLSSQINKQLQSMNKVTLIITSDEEALFPIHKIKHRGCTLYRQYTPHPGVRLFPVGYPPQLTKHKTDQKKQYDWCFLGQVNHDQRRHMVSQMRSIPNGFLLETEGFAQGFNPSVYYDYVAQSKVVLCPNGHVSPDSFRLYEALELGCIPVVADTSFWRALFTSYPFPIAIGDNWPLAVEYALENYQYLQPRIASWWRSYKLDIFYRLLHD